MNTTQTPTYTMGQTVLTNRAYGATGWTDKAVVIGIAATHLTIEYTAPATNDGDFMIVNRTYPNVRPA